MLETSSAYAIFDRVVQQDCLTVAAGKLSAQTAAPVAAGSLTGGVGNRARHRLLASTRST